ncbi:MAG TPA: FecR family protein [Polyangia bacterium]|nr:FecR family protein [Polyangia bacterium]
MTEPEIDRLATVARRANPPWSPARQQSVRWKMMTRIESARRRRPVLALSLVGAAALATFAGVMLTGQRSRPASVVDGAAGPLVSRLADGTRIVLDDAQTVLRKTVEASDDVLFELDAGGARFEVARRAARTFRVHAGEVTVQVIGTGFRMRRVLARCQVAVEHGRVLVSWWGGSRELGAGEQATFPPEAPPASPALPIAEPQVTPPPARRAPRPAPQAAPALPAAGPDTLFARADAARAEGKPALAVAILRELRQRFPRDPHAAAAAFTTGRLLLDSLGRPREAAAAFAEARALSGEGRTLAEDALAREVEALHAAGDDAAARARAERYRATYPRGARLRLVEKLGGLSVGAPAEP